MTSTQDSEQQLIESFLPAILESEAKAILQDIATLPGLSLMFMSLSAEQIVKAIQFVQGIFEECYRHGHLKVAVSHEDGQLYAYALLFVHPDPSHDRYCHKIFVFEQHRGRGLGTSLLQMMLDETHATCLLCSPDLVAFYERVGFELKGGFIAPGAQEGFSMTNGLYRDLQIMGTSRANGTAPVFMLNDQDIRQLLKIAVEE